MKHRPILDQCLKLYSVALRSEVTKNSQSRADCFKLKSPLQAFNADLSTAGRVFLHYLALLCASLYNNVINR